MKNDTWTRGPAEGGASNSQGPMRGIKDWQMQLLIASRTDTWQLQGLV